MDMKKLDDALREMKGILEEQEPNSKTYKEAKEIIESAKDILNEKKLEVTLDSVNTILVSCVRILISVDEKGKAQALKRCQENLDLETFW